MMIRPAVRFTLPALIEARQVLFDGSEVLVRTKEDEEVTVEEAELGSYWQDYCCQSVFDWMRIR